MRKLIITEEQLNNLQPIMENTEQFTEFKNFCNESIVFVDRINNLVMSTTISEILNKTFDLDKYENMLNGIERKLMGNNEMLYRSMGLDAYKDTVPEIDRIYDILSDKINKLMIIILNLQKLIDN
jgi:hypothetical protein